MGAFRYDNPFMSIMIRIANLMLLSFYWVLCCLPVVTLVPACTAIYHSTAKVVHGNGSGVTRDFFHTFVSELKQGVILTLFFAVGGALLAYGLFLGSQLYHDSIFGVIYLTVGILMALILVPSVLYAPATLSRFQGSVSVIVRLSLFFASQHPLRTIFMAVLLAVMVFLVDYYPVLLMILPGVYVDLVCAGMEKILQKYADDNGLVEESEEEEETVQPDAADLSATELDRMLTEEGK